MVSPKIGIIGTGNMGRIHARVLSSLRMLSGVMDVDIDAAKRVADMYGVRAFSDYHELVEEMSLDGVIISTPTSTHSSIAEDIASKHDSIRAMLIEKPIASTLKDAEHVAETLRKRGIVAIVSHSEIYNPIVGRALSLIREGAIGTPKNIIHDRRGFVQPSRIHSLGDVFEDLGVHDFDIMTRISTGRAKLYAQCITEGGVCNAATVMVKFESGSDHVFHLSRQYAGRARMMDVSGSKGALILDLFAQIIKVKDLDQEPMSEDQTIRLPERGATIKVYGEPVREVINDLVKVIETGSEPLVGLDDGVAAMRLVEAARQSAKNGTVVDIDIEAAKR
ncbi:MAG: Gfo/Idh/MocA family oxidoreductase [Candidatus Thorarchaeota archaeon]|nr:Gfo/Idh/MocA family oxidoreductase [Candidatus Thorarchaeota archaeon]